jgi:hypothetical protein
VHRASCDVRCRLTPAERLLFKAEERKAMPHFSAAAQFNRSLLVYAALFSPNLTDIFYFRR